MPYPLATLSESDELFHLDAISHIRNNPYDTLNHIIDIYLTRLPNDFLESPNADISSVYDPHKQTGAQISVGEFFGFQVGSIIKGGKILRRPGNVSFSRKVIINESTVRFASPTHLRPPENGGYGILPPLVPKHLIGLGAHGLGTLVAVQIGDDPYALLIPSTELFRFYHCSSSKLNKLLFSSGITELDRFINVDATHLDITTKSLKITLRRDFPAEDAAIIGRWVTSKTYHNSAHAMWRHLVKHGKSGCKNFLPIETSFPFEGETTLSGQGIEIPSQDYSKSTRILVLSLTQCTHTPPFEQLIIDRESPIPCDAKIEGENEGSTDNEDNNRPYRKRPKKPTHQENQFYEGENNPYLIPSGYFDTKLFRIPSNRFTPIKTTLEYSRTYEPGKIVIDENLPSIPKNQSTSEKSFTGSEVQQISTVPAEPSLSQEKKGSSKRAPAVPANFETFIEVCAHLEDSEDVLRIISIVTSPDIDDLPDGVSEFSTDVYNGSNWAILYGRPRQYMLKEVTAKNGKYYLLYLEQSKSDKTPKIEYYAFYLFRDKRNEELKISYIKTLLDSLSKRRFSRLSDELGAQGIYLTSIRRSTRITTIRDSIIKSLNSKAWQST